MEIGTQDQEELSRAIEEAVKRSSKYLSEPLRKELAEIVKEYSDIFGIKLGNDSPVDVSPMIIEIEGKEKPVKVCQRICSPEQLEFLKKKCDELVKAGFIYRNQNSKWACAQLIVPKQGLEKFRLTIDHRPINAQTKKNVWPMPHAEPMLAKLTGAKKFFKIDFIHGY